MLCLTALPDLHGLHINRVFCMPGAKYLHTDRGVVGFVCEWRKLVQHNRHVLEHSRIFEAFELTVHMKTDDHPIRVFYYIRTSRGPYYSVWVAPVRRYGAEEPTSVEVTFGPRLLSSSLMNEHSMLFPPNEQVTDLTSFMDSIDEIRADYVRKRLMD